MKPGPLRSILKSFFTRENSAVVVVLFVGFLLRLRQYLTGRSLWIDEAMLGVRPDAIMHFAAYALVGESMTNPLMYFRNNVIGGVFWHWHKPGRAHLDKLVVARSHRGKGVGDGILRELIRRLRGRGARSLGTGFYQAEYFKHYGFRTDPTSGGLVVELEPMPGTVPPAAASGAEA